MTRAGPVAHQLPPAAQELGRSLKKLGQEPAGDESNQRAVFEDVLLDELPEDETAGVTKTGIGLLLPQPSWRLHDDSLGSVDAASKDENGGGDGGTDDDRPDFEASSANPAVVPSPLAGSVDDLIMPWSQPSSLDAPEHGQSTINRPNAPLAGSDCPAHSDIRDARAIHLSMNLTPQSAPVPAPSRVPIADDNSWNDAASVAVDPATRPSLFAVPATRPDLLAADVKLPPMPVEGRVDTTRIGPLGESVPDAPSPLDDQPKRSASAESPIRGALLSSETFLGPVAPPSATLAGQIATPILANASSSGEPALLPTNYRPTPFRPVLKVLHIELNPPSLGSVSVRMALMDDTLRVVIQASDPATADLIRRDHDGLSRILESAGYRLEDLAIDVIPAASAQISSVSARGGDAAALQPLPLSQFNSSSTASDAGSYGARSQQRASDRDAPAPSSNEAGGATDPGSSGKGLYV